MYNNLVKFVILYIFYSYLFCYYVYLWLIKLIKYGATDILKQSKNCCCNYL